MYRFRIDRLIAVSIIAAVIYLISRFWGRIHMPDIEGMISFPGLGLDPGLSAILSLAVILLGIILLIRIVRG